MTIHRLGIRHHGPGSARSVLRAFERLRPDCVLIEGPPDANAVLALAGDRDMRPPVALLVYAAADPARAVFYPFAHFSPEWVAMRWALSHAVPVRFIDLPIALQLDGDDDDDDAAPGDRGHETEPLADMARVAGYDDVDLFWERLVETAGAGADPLAIFALIEDAMRAARAGGPPASTRELRREAHMRGQIRAAEREGFQRVAVIVGAWHAPALVLEEHTVKADRALVTGLSKTRTDVAWVPWTASRLAFASGYGAGVTAPGWYAHLFEDAAEAPAVGSGYRSVATSWAARAARMLREVGFNAGPAQAIEVVRTADALATLRGLAAAGLGELREALLAVLCAGEARRFELVRQRLEIGDALGEVPAEAPKTPLRRDVEAEMRRLGLKPVVETRERELDLRKERHREQAVLLHRLNALGVGYGERLVASGEGGTGTFREVWALSWDPAFEVELALAARWGNDLQTAAGARLVARADTAELAALANDLELALDARLDVAVAAILLAMDQRAAATSEVLQLGRALPGLARIIRYSDVRATERARVQPIFDGLFVRLAVGLPAAVRFVDSDGAEQYARLIDAVGGALGLVSSSQGGDGNDSDDPRWAEWTEALRRIAYDEAGSVHRPLVAGRAARALIDAERLSVSELELLASGALAASALPEAAAAWIEGLVRGSAILLEHQPRILEALDAWLDSLPQTVFVEVLPVLRRAFSEFTDTERRRLGARLAAPRRPEERSARARALAGARVEGLRAVLRAIYHDDAKRGGGG